MWLHIYIYIFTCSILGQVQYFLQNFENQMAGVFGCAGGLDLDCGNLFDTRSRIRNQLSYFIKKSVTFQAVVMIFS